MKNIADNCKTVPRYAKLCGASGAKIKSGVKYLRLSCALLCVALLMLAASCTFSDSASIMTERYGEPDMSELAADNAVNLSGVVSADDCCYAVAGGKNQKYEIRRIYPSGYDVIYSTINPISSIGLLGDRIFFVSKGSEGSRLYSVSSDGQDAKPELEKYNIRFVFAYGDRLYYVCNEYGSSSSAALVSVLEKSGGSGHVLRVIDSSSVSRVLEYMGHVYILYTDKDYKGHLLMMNVSDESSVFTVSLPEGTQEDIYSIAPGCGRVFISNVSGKGALRQLYSMAPDGSDMRSVASVAGSYMISYGEYIFYVSIQSQDGQNRYELHSIKNDGTDDRLISERPMINPGIAAGRVYYFDPESSVYCRMAANGDSFEII